MDLDVDVAGWALELLLRDCHNTTTSKKLLAVAPLPTNHDWRLKKTVLLRTIESAIHDDVSVNETILEALESIEALDRLEDLPTTAAMRAAYCAVATECTAKFLVFSRGEANEKYTEAVGRIWGGRVRVLDESEKSELVSAELKERRDEMEAAICDRSVLKRLARMNTRNDALKSVAGYVKEAWAAMGPSFIASAVICSKGISGEGCDNVGDELAVQMVNGAVLSGGSKPVAKVCDGIKPEVQMESDTEIGDGVNVSSRSRVELANRPDIGDGKEMEGQRAKRAGVKAQKACRANVGGDMCKQVARLVKNDGTGVDRVSDSKVVTVAYLNPGSAFGYHTTKGVRLKVVGPGRSLIYANRGVFNTERGTKEKEILRNMVVWDKHGLVEIRDAEDVGTDSSDGPNKFMSDTEVGEVQEQLKSSVMALRDVVTGPVPYALPVSDFVKTELERRSINHVTAEDSAASRSVEMNSYHSNSDTHFQLTYSYPKDVPQPIGSRTDAPSLSLDKGKGTVFRSCNLKPGDQFFSNQNTIPHPGLMERPITADTYKWDDSRGMSPEDTMNGKGRLHQPTPKQIAVSPVNKNEDKRLSKRRKVKRWSSHEEDTLRTGVQKYGKGNWKSILIAYGEVLVERTEVDLKDKWRNMMK